jgi:hypothetical protein
MRVLPIAFFIASVSVPAFAQKFGAAENLAPYIPTPEILVQRMLEAGRVKSGDMVYDLGSGDGRIVIMAAQKFGARGVGVEILPDLVKKAQDRIHSLGLDDRVRMVEDSALRIDLSPADVVTMCLLTSSNERLKPNLERDLHAGARVVSSEFPIRGWKALEVLFVKTGHTEHKIFVYEIGKHK